MSRPVGRSVPSVAATRADSEGWLVVPAMAAQAASTASTPGVDGCEERADLAAGGVVGVEVDGQVEPLAQRGDEGAGRRGAQQAGHVLDREDVRTGVDDLLGEPEVVVERVELLAGVAEVAGVAERDLGDRGVGREHGLDGGPHLAHVVERVEDPEDVEARSGPPRGRRRR